MTKIAALLCLAGVASAARLENAYLPPGSASPGFAQAPGLFNGAYNAGRNVPAGSYRDNGAQAIPITRYDSQNVGDGSYRFAYETANGIAAEETGVTKGDGAGSVSGHYSYTGTDGLRYAVRYTADEDGFHPEGAHLPTPPPVPEEIRRGVELSLAAEARGENQGGPEAYDEHRRSTGGGYRY